MNEDDVRALVREAIERHLGRPYRDLNSAHERDGRGRLQSSSDHPSHIMLTVLPGSEIDDGMCIIEPAVRCSHCGFCQSVGH